MENGQLTIVVLPTAMIEISRQRRHNNFPFSIGSDQLPDKPKFENVSQRLIFLLAVVKWRKRGAVWYGKPNLQ